MIQHPLLRGPLGFILFAATVATVEVIFNLIF